MVAPFVGAWIEMVLTLPMQLLKRSLRSSERGLKSNKASPIDTTYKVAPFVGAWIEIIRSGIGEEHGRVAPFVGAWIEIV